MIITTVRFNSASEFAEELIKSQLLQPVLRATRRWVESRNSPVIRHVYVVATSVAKIDGAALALLQLETFVGDDWGEDLPQTTKTYERADAQMKKLEDAAAKLGIEIRAGVFTVAAEG